MKSLTIAYVTARIEPKLEWFFDSLSPQLAGGDDVRVIVVDHYLDRRTEQELALRATPRDRHVAPKPNIWQGSHRITVVDWWAKSGALNTAFCLCETEWIAVLDDRCVVMPGYLDGIKRAMAGNYIALGSYEKRRGMQVERGVIVDPGETTGVDSRKKSHPRGMRGAPGSWLFGANFAMPLEWALDVNGFEEAMNGVSMEDSIFGLMLQNRRLPMVYDPDMAMIEDRTTMTEHDVDGTMKRADMKREDKGVSPNDKTHASLKRFGTRTSTDPAWTPNLRELRAHVLAGGDFPVPEQRTYYDWYDNAVINGT